MNFVDTAGDQRTQTYAYLNRRSLLKLICMAGLGPGLFINACNRPSVDPPQNSAAKENNKMESAITTSNSRQQIPPLDILQPQEIKTATFALGWFWGPDSRFGSQDGTLRTRVGYSGGETLYPTYRSMGDHSESIQIDYDSTRISYEKLLEIFWKNHDPTYRAWGRQYMAAIFYHDEKQKRLALESMASEEKRRNKKIQTEILPFGKFYLAEDYHQKYQLRQHRELMTEFKTMYPRTIDFINSTAAARVNGYVSGHGTPDEIKTNLENLGLSAAGSKRLLEIATRWRN